MQKRLSGRIARAGCELALLILVPLVPWLPAEFRTAGWLSVAGCALALTGKPRRVSARSKSGELGIMDLRWTTGPMMLIAFNTALIWSIYGTSLEKWAAPNARDFLDDVATIAGAVIALFGLVLLLIFVVAIGKNAWIKAVGAFGSLGLWAWLLYAAATGIWMSPWNFGVVQLICTASTMTLTFLTLSMLPIWEVHLISIRRGRRSLLHCVKFCTINDLDTDYLVDPEEVNFPNKIA